MEDDSKAGLAMAGSATEDLRPASFRSWAEDYRAPEPAIDREAFHFRRQQRGITRTAEKRAQAASIASGGSAIWYAQRQLAEAAGHANRENDPLLAAQLFLQRRGLVVYRASVVTPGASGWWVSGSGIVADEDLIALAAKHRSNSAAAR